MPIEQKEFSHWIRLLRFLKPYRLRFIGAIVLGMLNGLTAVALMQGVPLVLKTVFTSREATPQANLPNYVVTIFDTLAKAFTDHLTPWLVIFFTILLVPVIMIARAFTGYFSTYLMNWVGTKIITDLRHKTFTHIQSLSLDFYTRSNVGDLISRINNDCQQAQSAITTVVADSITQPFTLISVATFLIITDWKFSLAALVLAPMCILPIAIYGRKVRKTSKLAQENQGEILSCLHENITGVRVVKAFQMEEYEKDKFWQTCYRQFSFQMRIIRSVNILSPIIEVVGALGASAALFYAYTKGMPFEDLFKLLLGIYGLYNPIKNLSKLHTTIQKSLASTDRIFAILDTPPSVQESPSAITLKPIQQQIRFDQISFQYDSHLILKNLSLTVPHGKTVAFVGASGAGKTTLLNLIPRFYDSSKGKILIDGIDIREVTQISLRGQMALVTQDTVLFNDTIKNNIRYGSLKASDKQIMDAAERAHAHSFIIQQPQGYDTVVGDKGVKLSGGQKQRIAIARAILKNPSILLLDEATSALDTEAERIVQTALDELIKGRTVFVIAHRLSTIQNADIIVVMDKGEIIEQGTHQELLNKNNLYKKLHSLQFQKNTSN